jgi:osmotically-inducible protein OsmY
MRLAVKAAFSLDPYLRVLPITITVKPHSVTIEGQVYTPMQERLALRKLNGIVGSSNVTNRLTIGKGDHAKTTPERIDAGILRDAKMALAVRKKLKTARNLTVRNLRVTASDGVAVLHGEVDREADKNRALTLARDVDGVLSVVNRLTLPGEPPPDETSPSPDGSWKGKVHDIATLFRARRTLARSGELSPHRIEVSVRNSIVTLNGEVPAEEKLLLAEHLIRQLSGVDGVVNELQVTR